MIDSIEIVAILVKQADGRPTFPCIAVQWKFVDETSEITYKWETAHVTDCLYRGQYEYFYLSGVAAIK